jgi:adenylate cyclase
MPLPWLIPRPDDSGSDLVRRTQVLLTVSLVGANLVGAAIVYTIASWVFPYPDVEDLGATRIANVITLGAFFLLVTPLGIRWGSRRLADGRAWLEEDRAPTAEERRIVLRSPRRLVTMHLVIWSLAAVLFGVLNAFFSLELGERVALTIAFGGLTTCAFVYLLAERQLRPTAARALAAGVGDDRLAPGIKGRTLLAWALGTAVPILGLILVALSRLTEEDFSADELAVVVLSLGGLGLAVGLYLSMLSARAVADPVNSLRKAVREVEDGELDIEVPVYDASEIGQLQAGFNSMVAGLRERERIQDLFGRHVGEDVARAALDQGIELGGERREVAVLFTDVIGSTKLADERPPEEVVELLNSFFGFVVDVVDGHDGWVNKFEGDAALAVFGAPIPLEQAPSAALAAARELAERLPRELEGLEAAIGVSAGEVVAGNVGDERRFEYTVIGDPVNEAARLTELAKQRSPHLLASDSILERASEPESEHWRLDGTVTLRGRRAQTRLAEPVLGE